MFTFTCVFVCVTLFMSTLCSLFLVLSLFSDEWEFMSYGIVAVERAAKKANHSVEWLSGGAARVVLSDATNASRKVFYLIPAHGGVNRLCADIAASSRHLMIEDEYSPEDRCISYLSNEKVISKDSWVDRMRNLAMSCAIVSLILLGTSAPLGILGLIKKQISTIMVTGVMYILAAVFGVFNQVFMRFKRVKSDGFYTSTVLDMGISEEYMRARVFMPGWPPSLEWAGLCFCLIASLLWLLLAKIFRFVVLSNTMQ